MVGIHVFFLVTRPHSLVGGTSTLEVIAVHLSDTSVTTSQTIRCHNRPQYEGPQILSGGFTIHQTVLRQTAR